MALPSRRFKCKENKETGSLRVYTADGRIDYSGDIEEFKGRGNSTWVDHEKKPYNLTLPVPDELLGMEAGKRWILLANAYDPSHLCNVLVTQSAREIGLNYTPDSAWVDLYLNGEYAGLYLLSEKNEVANGRVTISGESGYLVSLERRERLVEGNKLYVSTLADQALRIHYPLLTESEQMQRIADVFQTAENAILAEEGIDPITQKHWADIIDLDSWVKKYLIDEIFANTDGGALSQYFYYTDTDSERKIYAGPVWDYDTTLGNEVPWQINHPESFYANRPSVKDGENTPWYHALYSKPVFYQRVTEIFEEELLPVITVLLDENIDAYVQKIRSSAAMNSIRWSLNNSLDNEVSRLKTFLAQRLQFLSEIWLEDAEFCMLQINPGANKHIVYQAVRPGATPPTLPTLENNQYQNFLGWYYSDTNEPFDPTKPIYSDLELYAKWEDSSSKKMGQIIKLIPLGVIGMMGAMMLAVEWRRGRKGR